MKLPFRYNLLVTLQIILVVFSQLLSHATEPRYCRGGKSDLLVHVSRGDQTGHWMPHFHSVCAFGLWSHCFKGTNQRKMCMWNKCCQAWFTLLLGLSVGIREPAMDIRGAISQQKHTKPDLYWLSDEDFVNMGSQKTSMSLNDSLFTCFRDFLDLTFTNDN